ncbi:MAG: hypothetical protein GAK31_01916 [Stenotrophomonas maltophilia]|uniref:MASE1 domain-containing protein n=1 Tax=Stenotrophomonas maltophilia TaxID=40324 RepID=A0A7V8FIJ3_STEMA|nr:MAG: hypothetical protein GAK31_01916 [Stenotrophomonas maltophilia]
MNWLKHSFELSFRIRPVGLALAVLYAVTCWITWHLSVDQFFLPAGIRVAALLLVPKRMWPYLILGEYAYFAHMRYPMIEQYGIGWVIIGSACLMPAVTLIVHLHYKVMAFTTEGWLLSIAASAALVASALKLGLLHVLWPVPPSMPFYSNAMLYVLSDYIAILTVAPLALLWMRRRSDYDWTAWRLRPTVAAFVSLSVMGVLLALIGPHDHSARATLQLLLVLPVIGLTCMHGWRGAAVGVPMMNIILSQTMPTTGLPGSFDQTTYFTQQIIAITATALISLGPRITHHYHRHATGPINALKASAFSRSAHLASEQDLRERVLDLRRIADDIEDALGDTVQRLKAEGHEAPATELLLSISQRAQQFRELTSMVYPTELEHAGLYVALEAGGLREAWDASHRVPRPALSGDPCRLSIGLQLAAYRAIAEAVSLLLKEEKGQIRVSVRCGRYQGVSGLLLNVALLDRSHALAPTTMDLAIDRLSARAHAYSGRVHFRGNRIRIAMLDAAAYDIRTPTPAERSNDCASPARY